MRLGVGDAGIHVDQPLAELGDKQLQRLAADAQIVRLMRLEPGATLLRLQLEKKLDRLVREPVEALHTGGHGCHPPQCTLLAT